MASDRPVSLNLGLPSGASAHTSTHTSTQTSADHQGQADARSAHDLAQDAQRLQALLAQRPPAQAQPADPQAMPVPTPFDLFQPAFASAPAQSQSQTPHPPQTLPEWGQALGQLVSRMLVGDGHSGRRMVELALDGERLSGASVQIFEEAGRWVVQWICARESTREYVCAQAPWLAQELAARLKHPVCVRVQTDDPQDPCTQESCAP